MRAVVQHVSEASVLVDGSVVGRLDGPGLCVLVGVTHGDTEDVAARLAVKIHELRTLRNRGATVETGRFGADMALSLVNDGPVTLLLEM